MGLLACVATTALACSSRMIDQSGIGGNAGATSDGSVGGQGGAGGVTPCPAMEPVLGSTCEGNWNSCYYATNTCCGHVYPARMSSCILNVVHLQYHEFTDCYLASNSCVDAGGFEAASADPQTPTCDASSLHFTPCNAVGQACRQTSGPPLACICQAAVAADGAAAPFWYCR